VAVVLVTHNSAPQLARCLHALATATSRIDARALVIDSASEDDPQAVCESHGVPVVRVPNRGLAAAVNVALQRDEVRRARYVLQLNPDVEFEPGGLDALVSVADQRPRWGIVAPRQVDQNNELVFSIGVEPSWRGYWQAVRTLQADWLRQRACYAHEREVDWMMGAVMLLRGEMLDEVGGFDERFFLCSEEVDLCRRARAKGWVVAYTPAVTVRHLVADRPSDPDRARLEEWSRRLYLGKWYPRVTRLSMLVALTLRYARIALLLLRHGQPAEDAIARLGATLLYRRDQYGSSEFIGQSAVETRR
jgi:N-acetylglucosaminyl-diphospho-decaprenol L-rhamnosyltransferase